MIMFNELQLHLWVNHVPIIGTIIGVLVVLLGAILKQDAVRKTGLVIYIVTGLAVFPANFTGEGAEDIVEDNVSWVSHDQIHEHEELAETAMTITVIGLALALLSLFQWPRTVGIQRLVSAAFLIVGIAGTITIGLAGHEGGKIMRPHLGAAEQPSSGATEQPGSGAAERSNEHDADDD